MPPRWKPQNGFHSGLEISHRTRDSHISTADHRHDRIEERRTGQSRRNHARSARRQTRGTLGGKVLKTRGPLLLKTDKTARDEELTGCDQEVAVRARGRFACARRRFDATRATACVRYRDTRGEFATERAR